MTVIMINCNLLVSLLVLQRLSHQRLIVRADDAGIGTRGLALSQLVQLVVAGHARLHAAVRVLARVTRMVASLFLVDVELGVGELPTVHLILLAALDIAGAWRHVPLWIERNKSVSPGPITGARARRLRAK